MADTAVSQETSESGATETPAAGKTRRVIKGNLPYTGSPGPLERALAQIPRAHRPDQFTRDFLNTVLNIRGGAANPIIPILKNTGLLDQGGHPTKLYENFQTESGRNNAALQALRNGFSEIFKRNVYAHKLDNDGLLDVIVSITGLPQKDQITRYILNTFNIFKTYAIKANENEIYSNNDTPPPDAPPSTLSTGNDARAPALRQQGLGLAYNINIILPETTNIDVFNAIFKSLKGNLLS